MPYDITTKDGIALTNIPDDMAPDSPVLKNWVQSMRIKGQKWREWTPEMAGVSGAVNEVQSALGGAARGTAAGLADVTGAVINPIVSGINSLLGTNFQGTQEAMSRLLTSVGVPDADTEAGRIIESASRGASAAGLTAGAAGGLAQVPGTVGRVAGALAANPVQQIAGGAGAGMAQQTAAELGAPVPVQLAAGLAGGLAGGGLVRNQGIPTTGAADELIKAGEQAGVPIMTSDVRQPRTFVGRTGQAIGERIPVVGTGPVRAAQQTARVESVRNLLKEYGADDAARVSDDIMADLARTRGDALKKWTDQKWNVIEKYDAIGPVPVNKTTQAIDTEIQNLRALKSAEYEPVINKLEDWKNAVQGQGMANLEALRKQFGEAFTDPSLAGVKTTGQASLNRIYGPLKQDIAAFIAKNGNEQDAVRFSKAFEELSGLAGELKKTTLASVLRSGDATPEMVNNLLFSQKPSDVQALYQNLSPAGQANARTAILARAAQKATTGADELSPTRFANEVRKLGTQIGVFFKDDQLKQVEGLKKVLDATRRAGEAAVNPPTGVQLALPVGLSSLVGAFGGGLEGFIGAMATGGLAGSAARIYESPTVRNILVQIGKAPAGSPMEVKLIQRLANVIQTNQEAR